MAASERTYAFLSTVPVVAAPTCVSSVDSSTHAPGGTQTDVVVTPEEKLMGAEPAADWRTTGAANMSSPK
jgi:hypothetical protein